MSHFKGVIAAGHATTAEVAGEILKAGGNAFDAAIAAMLVSFNTEPCMSSPGGGGFANIHTASGKTEILDFFCQTPRRKRSPEDCDFYPFTINFGEVTEDFQIGHGSHAVPGQIAGLFEMHRKYGTIPMRILAQPAIDIVKKGVEVDPFQHMDIVLLENMMNSNPEAKALYHPNGEFLQVGETLYMPQLADFLDMISREGPREFYEGEIAQKISDESQSKGGHIAMDDFVNYKVNSCQPTEIKYKGKKIRTTTFPSLGGLVIALGLGELSKLEENIPNHLSKEHVARLLKVLDKMENTTRRPEILFGHLETYENILFTKKWGSTTHFGILDAMGNAVSITLSNGEGSGYMIPGTNCFMNNMLGEAALLPDGFYSWNENTRLNSLMSPTIVVNEENKAEIIIGTGGAGRIPGAILQVLHYLLDYDLDVETAVHAPRMHLTGLDLNIEPGLENLSNYGKFNPSVWDKPNMYFGGVNTIISKNGNVDAVGDSRRYGVKLKV